MKKSLFIRAVCFAAVLMMCFPAALGAGDSDNMVKLLNDTPVFVDPGLKELSGVLSAGSVVYAGEYEFSEDTAALEIAFSCDRVIRTGYISLMSGLNTLTGAEAEAYAAKAPEGVIFRPGIILHDVSFTADDSFNADDSFDVVEAVPSEGAAVEPAEPVHAEPVPPEADPVPALPAEAALPADPADASSQGFAALPEGPFAGGASIPGFVKMLNNTTVCIDSALQRPLDELPAGAVVYADASDPVGGTVVVIFCVDYIIRSGFVSGAAVGPLTESETAEYMEKARDGIVFRPGVVLLNTVSRNSTAPEQPDLSDISAPAIPGPFAPAAATPEPTSAPTAAPAPATSAPTAGSAASDDGFLPANPQKGNYPLPSNKRYILNSEKAIRRGTNVNAVVLPVYAPGRAEGIIDFGILTPQGVLSIVASYAFSEDLTNGADRLVVPVNFSYAKGDTFALVRFLVTNTCTFAVHGGGQDDLELVYYDDKNGVFLTSPHVIPGYHINYHFR